MIRLHSLEAVPEALTEEDQATAGLTHCSSNDPSDLVKHAVAERNHFDIRQFVLPDGFGGGLDLGRGTCALHEDEFTAGAKQGSCQRNQCAESAHCSSGDLVERCVQAHILCAGTQDLDIVQPKRRHLVIEPGHAPFHRLDEYERHIRTCDGQHKSGESSARSDIAHPSWSKKRGQDGRVQDVPCPQARQFERADQSSFFALISQIGSKCPRGLDLAPEKGDCSSRFSFQRFWHSLS